MEKINKNPSLLLIVPSFCAAVGFGFWFGWMLVSGGYELIAKKPVNLASTGAINNAQSEVKAELIKEDAPKEASFLFIGDMMLDRNVYSQAKKRNNYNFPFEKISSFLKEADYAVANLEGPITDNASVSNGTDRLTFTFSPKYLPALKDYFSALNLANNHTLNFGAEGLEATRDYLDKNSIGYFGDPGNDEKELLKIVEENGIKIALVGYHALYNDKPEKAVEKIKKVRPQSDFVVILPHWGNEYVKTPAANQKKEARMFIDAGADLIIGTHPHVIETIEEYKGKYIFYSLGNFIFDQYFSVDTMQGLAVILKLRKGDGGGQIDGAQNTSLVKAAYNLYPITINKYSQAELASETKKKEILEWLSDNSEVSEGVMEEIKEGAIK